MLLFTRLTLVTQILDSYYAVPHAQKPRLKGLGKILLSHNNEKIINEKIINNEQPCSRN